MKLINPDYLQGRLRGRAYRGGGKGDVPETAVDPRITRFAQQGTFKPFALTTSAGRAFGNNEGQFGASSTGQFANVQNQSLSGVNQLLPSLQNALGQQPSQFGFNNNIQGRAGDIFNQQAALLQPQFQQQNQQLRNDLFGSGRLGLSLAGESVGAGQGGMVNPDAFGLGRAQSQTLGDLAVQSRQQALGENQSLFGIQQGIFGTNQQAQQQYISNLLGGTGQMFGMGQGVSAQELELFKAGLLGEQLRGGSYLDAANALSAGQVQGETGDGGKGNAFLGAAASVGAAAVPYIAAASDRRLKDNIDYVHTDKNGIKWYTWEWNDMAYKIGANRNNVEYGVIAQEVMEIYPEVVTLYPDGYYRVNYDMLRGME